MYQTCSNNKCRADIAYAVTSNHGSKVHRITFSKSLAEYIAKQVKDTEVKKVELHLSEPDNKTKLFAVCRKDTEWPLRVTMFKELADMWLTETTIIKGCKIKIKNN